MAVEFNLQRVLSGLGIIAAELGLAALICITVYWFVALIVSRTVTHHSRSRAAPAWLSAAKLRARRLLLVGFLAFAAIVLAYNGWLISRGLDAKDHTLAQIMSLDGEMRMTILVAFARLALSIIGLVIATRILRSLLRVAEDTINRWDRLATNNQSLAALFRGLDRVIVNTAWMFLAMFACGWFGAPQFFVDAIFLIIRIYLVISIGILVVRCTTVIVDTLDGLSESSARNRGWAHYYYQLRPLLPTFRTCLEYGLWVVVGSLLLLQIGPVNYLAAWGPRVIQAIGIFFLGRVVIELGSLEIKNRMLPDQGLEEMERRRRETIVPLIRSAFTYAVYFGAAVLMLGALGFNPMPFLAGAGILGLVVGFGAQSMIDDVVSGFFILFENTYLVGDTIAVGDAKGVVEAIEFRTTKIRDDDGRLHILRNGAIKPVINYSKDYTMAVVTVTVRYDADLRAVFNTLRAAGQQLRSENTDVLGDLEVEGITAFGEYSMTVRTAIRVKPGRHDSISAALRLLIKEMFDRQADGALRRTLIPELRPAVRPEGDSGSLSMVHRPA